MPDELTLEPPDDRPRRRLKLVKKSSQPALSVRLEAAFKSAYERTWKFPYFQTSPIEDRTHLKRLADQLGEEMALSLIEQFFQAVRPVADGGDPVVSRCRCSNVRDLNYHAQYLLLQRTRGPKLADRTAENIAEVVKAMGRTS